jgi:hypothetical protein
MTAPATAQWTEPEGTRLLPAIAPVFLRFDSALDAYVVTDEADATHMWVETVDEDTGEPSGIMVVQEYRPLERSQMMAFGTVLRPIRMAPARAGWVETGEDEYTLTLEADTDAAWVLDGDEYVLTPGAEVGPVDELITSDGDVLTVEG